MDNNPIGELMQNTMESVKNILKVDTVVGDPIYTPDGITLVPISKVSVGFGGGGVEFNSKKTGEQRPYGGGNATGVKIDPIGFLVIKDGTVRMGYPRSWTGWTRSLPSRRATRSERLILSE